MLFLYVLFALSILLPIYTYAFYPVLLKFLKVKSFDKEDIQPFVSVLIIGNYQNTETKAMKLSGLDYSNFEVIKSESIIDGVNKANGEIILFTDCNTELDANALIEIVKPFADKTVSGVVGMQTNSDGNSAFWKYENKVKQLESKIGCVSGANESVFAVRKADIPELNENIKNKIFYIATSITQNGKNLIYEPAAVAYEGITDGVNFDKHAEDAAGYWQALMLFPKMLFPRKGSFVYVSHRVLKWFVWLNLLTAFLANGALAFCSSIMLVLFCCQILGYSILLMLGKKKIKGPIGKLVGIGHYFLSLNVAYFVGLFK